MPNERTSPSDNTPDDDEQIETTFRRLRRDGHSRLEAVQLILDTLDVSLAEAKQLLLTHNTWAEARSATDSDASSGTSVPPAPG
ncbi:hypothetical protein BSZ35_02325 [Salinibacter sp. 10B]|uniref:hypothetical protein n=1 Tax=Salinibacter sp. 10B TaxID=1923971 RepID=UPI000CF3C00A|nr:hypothetical protein [Salinibacter sp. 10B]PQJ33588.1 hypothetical protein BSZ35_02325 [Salinibacter sp. 10B]